MSQSRQEKTLTVAAHAAALLDQYGLKTALIGALAVAAHGYPRDTQDLDLATSADPFTQLQSIAAALREAGFTVDLAMPDADDPLGGVLTITGDDFDDVQIVNFWNPLAPTSNPGAEAVETATGGMLSGSPLRVVDLPHLIALKLYAGGPKSTLDASQLLARNPNADMEAIRAVCARYDLAENWDMLVARCRGG